jgi:hypothetical protein
MRQARDATHGAAALAAQDVLRSGSLHAAADAARAAGDLPLRQDDWQHGWQHASDERE